MSGQGTGNGFMEIEIIRNPRRDRSTPVGHLGPCDWMHKAETRAVMAALSVDGAQVRFVGGCVRDAIAHKPVRDVDVATPDHPEAVIRLLEAAGIKAVPTGIAHGTVTAVVNRTPFEITTLRCDVTTDGRHATVNFTDNWIEDAARRDFTINAMSANADGDVYDYFDGIDDLNRGRIRFVGRAKDRVAEDRLRLLRYFRFHAHYGRPPLDKDALAACRAAAPELKQLSGERVRSELLRLLDAPDPAPTLNIMRGERVLEHLLPEASGVGSLRRLVWLETTAIRVDGVAPDPLRRLGVLLAGGPEDQSISGDLIGAVADRLRLSNRERDRLITMTIPRFEVGAEISKNAMRGLLYANGPEAVRDVALLSWARRLDAVSRLVRRETENRTALLDMAADWEAVEFPIGGRDAKALGVQAGPAMGALLDAVEAWWVAGGCRARRDACLEELKRRAR